MKVTAKNLKNLPDGIHRVDRGIYLRVKGDSRFFILKVQRDGKRREIGLGGIDQTLDGVRGKAARILGDIASGKAIEEISTRGKPKVKAKRIPTLTEFYDESVTRIAKLRQWRGKRTEYNWRLAFSHVAPRLGDMRIDMITPEDIADALDLQWGRPVGFSVQQYLKVVFDMAVTQGLITSNPAGWDRLETFIPKPSVMKRGKPTGHRAALTAEALRRAVDEICDTGRVVDMAILFGVFTVLRSTEFRTAKWSEIDFEAATLTIPPERRKDKKPEPFVVPLSRQAMAILEYLPRDGEYIFSVTGRGPVVAKSLVERIQKVSEGPVTIHGTRSTFADWCAKNDKNYLVSEKCLMHSVGGAVFMAYQRDDLLDQRRVLLQEWADYMLPFEEEGVE